MKHYGIDAPVGTTRLGGDPDVPVGFEWPTDDEGRAWGFLGQVRLDAVPDGSGRALLPKRGLVSVWVEQLPAAADPGRTRLFLFENEMKLRRHESPEAEDYVDEYLAGLKPRSVRAEVTVSVPTYEEGLRGLLGKSSLERFYEWLSALTPEGTLGVLLGHANAAEDEDLRRYVFLDDNGLKSAKYIGHYRTIAEYERYLAEAPARYGDDYAKTVRDWRPLVERRLAIQAQEDAFVGELEMFLRVNSNKAMSLLINDSDPIYFFVRRAELARGDFGRVFGRVTQG